VPDGYVVTPFGYFHSSCVQSLAEGEKLLANGRVQHANGTVAGNAAVCKYPHYTRDGKLVNSAANIGGARTNGSASTTSPEVNGWLENANVATGSPAVSYGALNARWTVPSQPLANDGQVLFFFPGLEDIDFTQSILQPVLTWYQGQWFLASWNCCLSGIVVSSPPVNVSPGDEIYGSITSTCAPGTLTCATWNVLTLDMSTGQSTTLGDTPSNGQIFNWAFGGVLEPYSVISCDDFPADGELRFEKVEVFDQNLRRVHNPKWGDSFNSTETPQCNYGVKSNPHKIALSY